jgi:hypothetical protein
MSSLSDPSRLKFPRPGWAGRLRSNTYADDEGVKRTAVEVVAGQVEFPPA